MPARKKNNQSNTPPPESPVPEYIKETRLYQRKRVTKRKLPSFEEAMLLLHIPEMAREYLGAVLAGLKARDKTALEHAGEMLNYIQRKGISINVAQQMMQQNAVAGPSSPVMGFDAIARQFAETRAGHALPAPEASIIDVRPADSVAVESNGH